MLLFAPGGMSFDDYFGFSGCDELRNGHPFSVGLSPTMLQRGTWWTRAGSALRNAAALPPIAACQLCAGVAAVETLKLLFAPPTCQTGPLGNGSTPIACATHTWRPGGYRNPLQRLMRYLVRRQLGLLD